MKEQINKSTATAVWLSALFFFRTVVFLPRELFIKNEPVVQNNIVPILIATGTMLVFSVFIAVVLTEKLQKAPQPYTLFTAALLIDSMFFRSLSDVLSLATTMIAGFLILVRKKYLLCAIASAICLFTFTWIVPATTFSVAPTVIAVLILDGSVAQAEASENQVKHKKRLPSINKTNNKKPPKAVFHLRWELPCAAVVGGCLFNVFHGEPTWKNVFDQTYSIAAFSQPATNIVLLLIVSTVPALLLCNAGFNLIFKKNKTKNSAAFRYANKMLLCMIILFLLHTVGIVIYRESMVFCINIAMPLILLATNAELAREVSTDVDVYRKTHPLLFYLIATGILCLYTFIAFCCTATETLFSMTNTRL